MKLKPTVTVIFLVIIYSAFVFTGLSCGRAYAELSGKPAGHQNLPPASEASLELMAGQMIMIGFRGVRPEANPILQDIKNYNLGGIILFDRDQNTLMPTRNVTSKEQLTLLVAGLHKQSAYPLFVAVDQEGGKVRRLKSEQGFMPLPSAQDLGAESIANTRRTAEEMSAELKEIGINMNFAPVADVNINSASPAIGALKRSFSSDAKQVADHARAFLQGMHTEGILGSLKHFPGHGSATADTHEGVADISETWRGEQELYPYKTLIHEGIVDTVMVGHLVNKNLDTNYPASLSYATITGLLRNKLGFNGVVVGDDLQMQAIVSGYSMDEVVLLALNAGMDILLYGNNIVYDPELAPKLHGTILKLIRNGKVSRERVEESYTRIRRLKEKLEKFNLAVAK